MLAAAIAVAGTVLDKGLWVGKVLQWSKIFQQSHLDLNLIVTPVVCENVV